MEEWILNANTMKTVGVMENREGGIYGSKIDQQGENLEIWVLT